MKKIVYFFLLLIFTPAMVFSQISGDGSYGNPYTGTMTVPAQHFTISGTKYFTYISVSGGTLNISPGATLYAKTTDSYINIFSTGILNAAGTSESIITFSADNNGDGVVGVTETWKNITFELSTGSSIIDYAIIEHGTGNDGYGWGGGVFIYGNNITLTNSTIRNCNISGDGGGLYLYATGSNNTLQNLIIHDNSATGNGGGLGIDGEAASTINGCNIYSNSANFGDGVYFLYTGTITNSLIHGHSSGEGVYIDVSVSNTSIRNCLIYNNTTGINFYGTGDAVNCDIINNITGIRSPNTPAPKVVNSILWGNATQYNISGGSLELGFCGIQGGLSGGTDGGGNKNLSATNGANTGPNFVNTTTPDYHLNAAIAPLIDGGTGSYGALTIPSSDIEGKSRIGTTDIGAYEFTYYIWSGNTSTDWATSSNWEGLPSFVPTSIVENKVVIPKGRPNYPTTSILSLATRSVLTMEPQTGLTVTGATTIGTGCTFTLESDATGSANFITGSSVDGNAIIRLFLAGGGGPDYRWHYVTTPINDYTKVALTTDINNSYNLLNYREDLATTDKIQGWNWHDGYGGSPGFSSLIISRGYNLYIASDQTATFTGTPLTGSDIYNSSISAGSGDPIIRGWNLIGNPFTSAVDANNFVLSARIVDKSIYFTKDNQYMSWNTSTGVGVGSGVSNIVMPLQGFFVHAVSTPPGTKSVRIPASSRLYATNSLYKGSEPISEPKGGYSFPILKFKISDGASLSDDAIIYFFNDATTTFDTDYDAYKLFGDNQVNPQIYTLSDNIKFSINGLPFPNKITTVPLNIRIGVAKDYTINVLNLENLTDCKVTLIDGTNRIDLKSNPNYTFSATAGTISNMAIEFDMSITTKVDVPSIDQSAIWYSNGSVFVKINMAGFENNSAFEVYDVNGKVVFSKNNISVGKGETVEVPVRLDYGFYVTNLINKNARLTKKIVISY
jgi:parallel beta-helix repeat protein